MRKDHDKAIGYAKQWLSTIGEGDSTVTTEECQFCHSQGAPEPVAQAIEKDGFFIPKNGKDVLRHLFFLFFKVFLVILLGIL